jgi:hypothetical protein
MSQEVVAKVIARALGDVEFRSQLFSDPDEALSGYDLTEEQRASLNALEEETFDAFASEVEDRVSRAMIVIPGSIRMEISDVKRLFLP